MINFTLPAQIQYWAMIVIIIITIGVVISSVLVRKSVPQQYISFVVIYFSIYVFLDRNLVDMSRLDDKGGMVPLAMAVKTSVLLGVAFKYLLLPTILYAYPIYLLFRPIAYSVRVYREYRILLRLTFLFCFVSAVTQILLWPKAGEVIGIAGAPEAAYLYNAYRWHMKYCILIPLLIVVIQDSKIRPKTPRIYDDNTQPPPPASLINKSSDDKMSDNPYSYR